MSKQEKIERIAKILARATSDNPAESALSRSSAFNRMQRDGVEFEDLLGLKRELLYQETLASLAELISNKRDDLSQSGKRELYSKYFSLIYEKFNDTSRCSSNKQQRRSEQEDFDRRRREDEEQIRRRKEADQTRRKKEAEEAKKAEEDREEKSRDEERDRAEREEKERLNRVNEKIAETLKRRDELVKTSKNRRKLFFAAIVVLVGAAALMITQSETKEKVRQFDEGKANTNANTTNKLMKAEDAYASNGVPGFDCRKSKSLAEHLVCKNSTISSLDAEMNSLYKLIKNKDINIRKEQLLWIKERDKCNDEICLLESYKLRISELEMKVAN